MKKHLVRVFLVAAAMSAPAGTGTVSAASLPINLLPMGDSITALAVT